MIRRNTWIMLIVLAVLIGASFALNNRALLNELESDPTTTAAEFLFSSEEGLPSRIRVEAASSETVELQHNEAGEWTLIQPEAVPADQGLAESAASQIAALRVLDEVDLAINVIGLDQPDYRVEIEFTSGNTHKLEIGSLTPSQSGYYVRVDGTRSVIVSGTSLDAVLNLVAAPPYAETPTPSSNSPSSTPGQDSNPGSTPSP